MALAGAWTGPAAIAALSIASIGAVASGLIGYQLPIGKARTGKRTSQPAYVQRLNSRKFNTRENNQDLAA
jgi:hypothetical protein